MPEIIENESNGAEWRSFLAEVNQLRDAIAAGDLKRRLTTENHGTETAQVKDLHDPSPLVCN